MAEESKNPVSEPLQKGAQAASAVRGAVKTGKAIAAAAKGAAAGGPYGAAAGFVWENRKLIGKIIIAVIALLMLPILILCMLPSLIFGGLKDAFSPERPDVPILNDGAAVTANIDEITAAVDSVFRERMTDLFAQIDADFAESGAEGKEIINPYADSSGANADLLIGQYCASKSEDFGAVSLTELENLLRQHKDSLYSYSRELGEHTVLVQTVSVDSSTGKEIETVTPVTKLWATYTVNFCGDDYFAEQVFHLSDEQKALAADYAQNLSLFLADAGAG